VISICLLPKYHKFPFSTGHCFWVDGVLTKISHVLDVLTKENIVEPMRDIRRALLEADVIWFLCFRSAFLLWFLLKG